MQENTSIWQEATGTHNISARREVVEFRWDTQNTQTMSDWEYWKYRGGKGRERQRGYGPRTSVLMDINNLEIRSIFTKLSLGITLVVWIREFGSDLYQEKTGSGRCLDSTIEKKQVPNTHSRCRAQREWLEKRERETERGTERVRIRVCMRERESENKRRKERRGKKERVREVERAER